MNKGLCLLLLAVASASAIVCPPGICENANCHVLTAENCAGRIEKNGGFCGCCDQCVHALVLLGAPLSAECGHGLVCDSHSYTCKTLSRTRAAPTCVELQQQILAANNGQPLLGQYVPQCDDAGNYAVRQCHGSVCFCVDNNGAKILDYSGAIGDATMDCKCARDQYDYMQTGLIGKLFFCTNSGSYKH